MTTTIGIGTSEDSKLALYTNSEKRLVIDNDGRVIVGSEIFRGNKFDKLTIRDDTVQTDPATGDNVDTDVNIFTYAPLGVSRLFLSSNGTDAWIEGEGHGNGKHSLKFITEGSGGQLERVRIDGGGNVGIGTTEPGARLEIKAETQDDQKTAFNVTDSGGVSLLSVRNDGNVGIGTTLTHRFNSTSMVLRFSVVT